MTRFACLLILVTSGCDCGSDSHPADMDSGPDITFDATMPDTGPRVDGGPGDVDGGPMPRDAGMMVCGNGALEMGEACDDGNTMDGDGCNSACRREAFCGDGMRDMTLGEVCDDGNNASGDGCRSDCLSDETCGNGERDVVVGELCDDGNTMAGDGCSADCTSVESCGNGAMDPGETCDDGNLVRWDGCGPDCLEETSLIANTLEIGAPDEGCDYTLDGMVDNRFGEAFGGGRGVVNMQIDDALAGGDLILLMTMLGLDDRSGAMDASFRTAVLNGIDADTPADASNNFSGTGEFLIDMAALGSDGLPTASLESRVMMRMLSGGPEDISFVLPFGGVALPLDLRQARISGTTRATGGVLSGIDSGLLCGVIPIRTLAMVPNPIGMVPGGPSESCDGMMDLGTVADLLVGGVTIFIIDIGPASPDIDLDGDGLETFEVDDMGSSGCQGVITACIDGDGTRIEGRACATDPRIADGFSAGLPFTAVGATIVGTM